MIVNKSTSGIHIISHAAHGLLAGNLSLHISNEIMPEQRFETIIAVTEHDDRQLDFDNKEYLSDLGVPLDFTENSASIHQVLKRMQRVINSVKMKSSWTRMLVSFHLEFLYGDLKVGSKKIKSFLKEEKVARKTILANYNLAYSKGEECYEILRFCDRLSLILCSNEVPNAGRKLEINDSIHNERYFISKADDETLIVEPWIFSSTKFTVGVEEKILELVKFDSSKEFEKMLNTTNPSRREWNFKKSD